MKFVYAILFSVCYSSILGQQVDLDSLSLKLPVGHEHPIDGFDITSEKKVFTFNEEGEFFLWDLKSGNLIKDFHLQIQGSKLCAVFYMNQEFLAFCSDGSVFVFSSESKEPEQILLSNNHNFEKILRSPEGFYRIGQRYIEKLSIELQIQYQQSTEHDIDFSFLSKDSTELIVASKGGEFSLYDARACKLNIHFNLGITLHGIELSMTEQQFILLTKSEGIFIFDSAQNDLKSIKDSNQTKVYAAKVFDKYLVYSTLSNSLEIWDLFNNILVQHFQFEALPLDFIIDSENEVIYVSSKNAHLSCYHFNGDLINQVSIDSPVYEFNFIPKSDLILAQQSKSLLFFSKKLVLYNSFKNEIQKLSNIEVIDNVLVGSTSKGELFFLDKLFQIKYDKLQLHQGLIWELKWDQQTEVLYSNSSDGTIQKTDFENKKVIETLHGHEGAVRSMAFSDDHSRLLSIGNDGKLCIWNTLNNQLIVQKKLSNKPLRCISRCPKMAIYAIATWENKIIFIDEDGDVIYEFGDLLNSIESISFSQNGQFMLVEYWNVGYKLYKFDSLIPQLKIIFSENRDKWLVAQFNPYADQLFVVDSIGQFTVYQLPGLMIQFETLTQQFVSDFIIGDNGSILLLNKLNELTIINGSTFDFSSKSSGFNSNYLKLIFNEKNNLLYSLSENNQLIFWNQTGEQIIPLLECQFFINGGVFLKLPNSPYYMCSKDASKMLHYVTPSLKVIGFEQLDPVYNRPDIVLDSISKYFGGADQELIANYRQSWEKRIDRLGLDKEKLGKGEIAVPSAEIVGADQIAYENIEGKINIDVNANDAKYPLRRFNVYVNEVPLYGSAGISIAHLNKQVWDTTISVPLSIGDNKIQVSVINELGLENFKYPTYVNYTPQEQLQAKTYYIGIGVNEFAQSAHNLKYCVKDVRDLAKAFSTANSITDTLLFTNEQVTRENILALKTMLLQTTVNDKVIISCSSHGLLDDSLNFYLAMHDVDFKNPKLRGLKYEELESLLDGIPARQKLLLLDACNSGENDKTELLKKEIEQNQNTMDTTQLLAARGVVVELEEENTNNFKKINELFVNVRNNTGSVIISAAGGQQSALEAIEVDGKIIENGAFTYSILECLKQNEGKELKVNALKQYAEKRVEEITNGKQKPTSRQETMEIDWGVR